MHAEAALFDHVQTCELIDRRYGWDCTAWSEHADGVTVDIEEIATGRRETLRGALSRRLRRRPRHRAPAARHRLSSARRLRLQAYLGGPMVSTYLRARGLPDVARTRCWQYWIVNRRHSRQHRRGRRRDRIPVQHAARAARPETRSGHDRLRLPRGGRPRHSRRVHRPRHLDRRASSSSPSASARDASGWRATPCICSRRPAASA